MQYINANAYSGTKLKVVANLIRNRIVIDPLKLVDEDVDLRRVAAAASR